MALPCIRAIVVGASFLIPAVIMFLVRHVPAALMQRLDIWRG